MKVTLIGNSNGVYVDSRNCNAYVDYTVAENYKNVNMDAVNHLVVRREDDGKMHIVQANGWSPEEGVFNRMY